MSVEAVPLKEWLRKARVVNDLYLGMMALKFDLDGAADAGQHGVAWWARGELLITGVELHLLESGCSFSTPEDRVERALAALRLLERVNPGLASEVWELWLRPFQAPEDNLGEVDRTIEFISSRLGHDFLLSRPDTVRRWASNTRILRTVARSLGIAQSDDWYLNDTAAGTPEQGWYEEVLAILEEAERP